MKRLPIWLGALRLCLSAGAAAQSGTYSKMNEYSISTPSSFPEGITAGPDGALWFAENGCYLGACNIGRITTAGVITQYPVPTPYSSPTSITAGPDSALWFTEASGQIGRITTAGEITEFPVPTPNSGPRGITAGPDGALWFTEALSSKIGRVTTAGVFTEYPVGVAQEDYLEYITTGPDGALWFTWTEFPNAGVGRITTAGAISEYQVPITYGPFGEAGGITSGPDRALWFADTAGNIWRLTTAGVFTQYPVPIRPSGGGTGWIAAGPDGALWFTVTCNPCAHDQIGRITTSGVITEFPVPNDGSLGGIAAGPDGALWSTITGFELSIDSDILRTPACALGLSASFNGTTLTLNFDLGIDTPAAFNILLKNSAGTTIGDLLSKEIPGAVPPQAFSIEWDSFPNLGEVTVLPVLGSGSGQPICSEWSTVNTAP
jgi:virginiamycin B lyase